MTKKSEILKKYFGYDQFRQGQEILIDAILQGRDVLGIMPTGAGKSICYQVPALLLEGITIVISPLISLMKDQVQGLNQAGIHAAYINSSLTETQIAKALQLAAQGRYKIIYVAPERLETWNFMDFASRTDISMVTIDEAHCISQWGQDFRPSYLKIVDFIRQLPKRPIVSAFTATATTAVKEDISCVLGLQNPEILVTGFDRKNLYFEVCQTKQKDDYLMEYVERHKMESGIIYCATRKNVDSVYEMLIHSGLPATKYHAGLSNEERRQNQEDFIYDVKPIVVATNAFGMGIDKSNVRYVIHYNMPQSMENYYQEAGRAGRDGEESECILMYSPQDVMINQFLIDNKEQKQEDITWDEQQAIKERDEQRLRSMTYYCVTKNCLRDYILQYFGERPGANCNNCSNCLGEFEELDVTQVAADIISCINECHGRYGINVIVGTVRGDKKSKLLAYGVNKLESYGKQSGMKEAVLKQIINQMLADGLLCVTKDKYALLRLTRESKEILSGERTVTLKTSKEELEASKKKASSDSTSKAKSKSRRSDLLTSKGLDLFEHLREVRMKLAREANLPPYIVFSDKSLVDMCMKLPQNKSQLLEVSGVGEHKYEKYGEAFLSAIKEYANGSREEMYYPEI